MHALMAACCLPHRPQPQEEESDECCHMPDISGMEGTKDFWVLCLSLTLSLTTFLVILYRMGSQVGAHLRALPVGHRPVALPVVATAAWQQIVDPPLAA